MSDRQPAAKYITLTDSQVCELQEFYVHAVSEAHSGRPGMLVAQIGAKSTHTMKVGFLSYEVARQFAKGSGFNQPFAEPKAPEATAESTEPEFARLSI